ncbi:MAG: cache domain-containing protein, partial [Candidatus Omnitrophota bacterium]
AINPLFNAFSSFPFVESLFIVDLDGILRQGIYHNQDKIDMDRVFDNYIGEDLSSRDYYKGVSSRWAPYISQVYKRATFPYNNVITVAVPIRDIEDAGVIGVLGMHIRLRVFAQWVNEISIGPGGFIYIVDQSGHLVYHPEYDTEKDLVDYSHMSAVRDLLKGLSASGIDFFKTKNKKYLVAYEPVHKYGWGVVVAQPVKMAFGSRDKNSIFALIIYGFIMAVALLSAFVIINILVARVRMDAELRKSESRYRGLYSSIRDGLAMVDMKGAFIDCNQAFWDMLEFSREDLEKMAFVNFTPEKWHALEKSIVEGQVLTRGYSDEFEKEYIRKTGEIFPVVVRIWLAKDDQGNPMGLWYIVRDITDRKRAEEEIRVLNLQLHEHALGLEAVNKELQAFSYSVSHDLRAPLRAIEGFSKILVAEQGDKLDTRGKDYLNRISAAARSMSTLIDDLLDLAKVARAPCRKEQFDLSVLAHEVCDGLSAAFPGSRARCSIAAGMRAYGDIQLCRIMLENLLGNAWKFSSKVPQPAIEVGMTKKDNMDVFFVRDNGAGFDMAYVNKLFAPFQRLHSAADFPGSGVGLASVYRIISRHGGTVWAEGEVNKGATFYFTI